jgi:hypothetical protein
MANHPLPDLTSTFSHNHGLAAERRVWDALLAEERVWSGGFGSGGYGSSERMMCVWCTPGCDAEGEGEGDLPRVAEGRERAREMDGREVKEDVEVGKRGWGG